MKLSVKNKRTKLSNPIGKRGASKKSRIFKMPKAKSPMVKKKLDLGKSPTARRQPKYKGVPVSHMYGD